jgi:hypothetical protein
LAAIPALVWAAWPATPKPIAVKVVAFEGVRNQRMDDSTFRLRWAGVSELPPMTIGGGATRSSGGAQASGVTGAFREARTLPPPMVRTVVRRASLRGDVCSRHGLRKVNVTRGRWPSWRCKR